MLNLNYVNVMCWNRSFIHCRARLYTLMLNRMLIVGANGPRPFPPQLLFKSSERKVVVEGQDVSLRCFFSGK